MKSRLVMALLMLSVSWYSCSSDGAKQRAEEPPSDPAAATEQAEVHGTEIKTVALTTNSTRRNYDQAGSTYL